MFDPAEVVAILPASQPDLVVTDGPYGQQVTWQGCLEVGVEPPPQMVRSVASILRDDAIVAFTVRARKVSLWPDLRALERFRIGKRSAFLARASHLKEPR